MQLPGLHQQVTMIWTTPSALITDVFCRFYPHHNSTTIYNLNSWHIQLFETKYLAVRSRLADRKCAEGSQGTWPPTPRYPAVRSNSHSKHTPFCLRLHSANMWRPHPRYKHMGTAEPERILQNPPRAPGPVNTGDPVSPQFVDSTKMSTPPS